MSEAREVRAAFEKWHRSKWPMTSLSSEEYGPEYADVDAENRWQGWQASAVTEPGREFRDMLMEVMQAIEGRWMEGWLSPTAYAAIIVRANGLLNRDVARQPAPPAPAQAETFHTSSVWDKPAQPASELESSLRRAREQAEQGPEITVADGERLIRKMELCTSMTAKLLLLRHFVIKMARQISSGASIGGLVFHL